MRVTRQAFVDHQLSLLHFWERARDEEGGGFHVQIDPRGTVKPSPFKAVVPHARLLYNYAEGIRAGHAFCHAHAAHAWDFLRGRMRCPDGHFTELFKGQPHRTERLNVYNNLFVVIGLGRYAAALGDAALLREAVELLDLLETRARIGDSPVDGLMHTVMQADQEASGPGPGPGWFGSGGHVSGNVMLHYLEALCVLRDAGVAGLEPKAAGLRAFFLRHVLDPEFHVAYDEFDGDYARPERGPGAIASVGHALEWIAFFRDFPGQRLDHATEAGILGRALADGVREDGLFIDSFHYPEHRTAGRSSFWPQVEAILTFHRVVPEFGEPARAAFDKLAACYFSRYIDTDGGVFHAIDPNGVVSNRWKGDFWKVDYHSMRMCVEVITNPEGHLRGR